MTPFMYNVHEYIEEDLSTDLHEYIEENWEEIWRDWDDDQALEAYSLECAFGPEE